MAYDQVSLFLYPPGWQRHSVEDRGMKHHRGGYVRIVSAIRRPDADGLAVSMDAVCRWLASRKFGVIGLEPHYATYGNGAAPSPFGPRQEIEISVSAEGGEVMSLYCRFALTPDTPSHLERWEFFMHELCGAFDLGIAVADGETVNSECFLAILQQADNWQYFAEHYGWAGSGQE